jgi:hypothetical protein
MRDYPEMEKTARHSPDERPDPSILKQHRSGIG